MMVVNILSKWQIMLIASGKYEHRESAVANGIYETWRYEHTGNEQVLGIVFQAQYMLNATVYLNENNQPRQFEYYVEDSLNGTYQVENDQLKVKRTLPYNTVLEDTLVWSDKTMLDLPFLSCKSHTILHLVKYGISPTFAPILWSGDRAGDLAKKSASFISEEEIIINKTMYQTRHFRYMRDYWLDEHNTVLRMRDNEYEVILVEYER